MGRWARQAALVLLLGVAPLALLEGGLRLAGWPTGRVRSFSKLLNFDAQSWNAGIGVFRPGARTTVMWPPELAYHVHINSLGLRGPEIERTAPPGRARILALGDSMVFGYYLEEAETWPARLEARLRAAGADVEVVNGGCGAWSIDSETEFLIERGLALEPHRVLVGFFANDLGDLDRHTHVYSGLKRAVGGLRGRYLRAVSSTAVYELVLRASTAIRHWLRMPDEGEGPGGIQTPPPGSDAQWARYAEWLDRMRDAVAAHHAALTLVYLPNAAEVLRGEEQPFESRLRELAAQRAIGFISPLAELRANADPALFHLPLDEHFAAPGADLIAQVTARELLRERNIAATPANRTQDQLAGSTQRP
jgi:lysophospholipase L1-like esterase